MGKSKRLPLLPESDGSTRSFPVQPREIETGEGLPPLFERGPSRGHYRRDWKREVEVRVKLRRSQASEVRALASQWGVPMATACWAILSDRLDYFRRRSGELETPFEVVATHLILRLDLSDLTASSPDDSDGSV